MAEEPQEFDEEGNELGSDAQVWKTYVRETDHADEERVDGWNKSMDVILIFAALFSAISTAFVIESYKSLKQDPTDLSSQTLFTISQTLMFIANGSQPGTPTFETEVPTFQASTKDICVNVLWFLSLSLSVAVSLISMLAKEWCLEFMAGRNGSPRAQARRRQQRWDGLVQWKMEELITMLPSLIHMSLLLFAIGLCIFLWDVHYGVAIPVVIVTTFAAGTYFACTLVPFLHDHCPYGTVLSRFAKRLMTIRSQPAQDNEIQDKVTANALDWMIVNCETPRSVDITLQSLAAADEKLPIKDLEKHHAWVMIRQRLKRMNMDKRSEQNQKAVDLYARAVQFYLDTKSKTDMLHYESIGFLPEKERQVVRIRATIRSLIDELLLHVNHEDVTQVLNRCSSIGRSLLSQAGQLVRGDNSGSDGHGPGAAIEPVGLAEDLVNRLEKYLKGEVAFDSDLYRTLSASFAFVLWCNAAQDPTAQSVNIGYVRRLIRARSLGSEKTASEFEQTIAPSLALGTLWLLLSSRHSDEHLDDELLPEPLEYFWATLMTVAYSDSSALKDLDVTYLAHGMLYLLANPGEYNLSVEDCVTIESVLDQTVYSLSGKFPVKIQSVCHARYIYCLNRNIAIIDDKSAFASQVFRAVHNLRYYSPWDDYYILPSSGAYVLLLNQLCKNSNNDFYTYRVLAYSPIPKISPQLVQEISLSDLITHLSAAVDSEDQDIQLFATAQLWVFFNMSMCDADRTSHTLSALETELLKHPGLDNNLERQEAVADELETKLMGIDEVSYLLEDYIYRIREVIMQRRSTPLPRSIDSKLKLIPERLRGIKSFVNFETERSVAYPDLLFDSEGRPSRVSPTQEE